MEVTFTIRAGSCPAAMTQIRQKMNDLAPGMVWTLHPATVHPADNKPNADGQHTGPPWLFDCSVTAEAPLPDPAMP